MTEDQKRDLAKSMAELLLSDPDVQRAVLSVVFRCPNVVMRY